MQELSSYRPHDSGHDYYEPGIYLITLVVRNRSQHQTLLGSLNNDPTSPGVILSEVGRAVAEEWEKTPLIQARRGNRISVLNQIVMPDHWHGVIQVHERMNKSLGHIMQYVKSACTARWHEMTGSQLDMSSSQAIRSMSERQRQDYYDTLPASYHPLFDDNYDDTICINEEHRRRMLHYVDDNPRRAIIRRMYPDYMRRCLHIVIDGRDYAAYGNMFLLRWARKVQVYCHRKARYGSLSEEERLRMGITYSAIDELITSMPYELTDAYQRDRRVWTEQIMSGQTVIVTPGISKGEQMMKDECLDKGYPLIHLQKEPIGRYWKPEERRFDACVKGALLILAPWKAEELGQIDGIASNSNYSIFHNLNTLAEEICRFDGEARIVRDF